MTEHVEMIPYPVELVSLTPNQAGVILGWCPSSAIGHVAAAIVSGKFGCEVRGKVRDKWIHLKIWGDDVKYADQIVEFASLFRYYDNEKLFDRVTLSVMRYRDFFC